MTIEALADPRFFKREGDEANFSAEQKAALDTCLSRWREHFETGRFRVTLPLDRALAETSERITATSASFWTSPLSFASLPEHDPALLQDLQQAGLVVFKVNCAWFR